jgi:gluconolactonase
MTPTQPAGLRAFHLLGHALLARRPARGAGRHFEGRELNSPNDLCVKSDGSVWFTDPWYGRMPGFGVERPRELGFQGVYRMPPGHRPGAEPALVVDRYTLHHAERPVLLARRVRLLYVNDTEQANIRVYRRRRDDRLENGRIFAAGHQGQPETRRARRHEMRRRGQCLGHRARRPLGLCALGQADRQGRDPGAVGEPALGRAGLAHALCLRLDQRLFAIDVKVGPRNEPFMRARAAAAAGRPPAAAGEPLRLDASRCALIIQDMQNDVVMEGGAFAESARPSIAASRTPSPTSPAWPSAAARSACR